jgi:hypothetical protein
MSNLGIQAVIRAHQSVGVAEVTENWSKWIAVYLRFVGIRRPAPWCSAFVAYKIHQAASDLKVKVQWPRKAYVQDVFNWARTRDIVHSDPLPGRAFVVYHKDLNRYAHIGLIVEVRKIFGKTQFLTVEGNSNTDGGREGKAVVSVWRNWDPARHKAIAVI